MCLTGSGKRYEVFQTDNVVFRSKRSESVGRLYHEPALVPIHSILGVGRVSRVSRANGPASRISWSRWGVGRGRVIRLLSKTPRRRVLVRDSGPRGPRDPAHRRQHTGPPAEEPTRPRPLLEN